MITESAVVTRRLGTRVELEVQRENACGGCELSNSCGTGALGRLLGKRVRPVIIENSHDLNPGDRLLLGVPEAALVKASLIVYGLPLLGMVLAGLLLSLMNFSEGLVALGALAGFVVGFKCSDLATARLEENLLTPYIIEVDVNPGP